MLASSTSVPDFPHNAQAWSAWLICVKKELDDVCRLLPDEDENAFDWLRRASETLESAALHAKHRSLQVTQKLQRKFTPHSVTPIPKRAPKRPAAPKHEEQIEEQIKQEGTSEQLVPPQLQPKREHHSKQNAAPEQSAASKRRRIKQKETSELLVTPKLSPKPEQQSKQDETPPHFFDPWAVFDNCDFVANVDMQFDGQPVQPALLTHEEKWQEDDQWWENNQVKQQDWHDWPEEKDEQGKWEETNVKESIGITNDI